MKLDDLLTKYILQAMNLLLLNYPLRSSIAILFAVLVSLGFNSFPILIELSRANNSASTRYFFSLIAYLIVHIKTIVDAVTGKVISEDILHVINLIERSNLSDAQKRTQYSKAIEARIKTIGQKENSKEISKAESP
ncbi:hypothetical protein [Pantoea ananatis]|uniref:hypothetical protein n=1 Tax=Pantoea ananas TaxID=553 RepID=UPI001B3145B8|nr:hypothetical protein [Pantoea ananatis]